MRITKLFPEFSAVYRRFYTKHRRFFSAVMFFVTVCAMTPLLDTYLNVTLIDEVLPQGDMKGVMKLLAVFTLIYLFNITAGFLIQRAITKKNNEIVEEMKLCTASGMHKGFVSKGLDERSRMTVVLTNDITTVVTFMSNSVMSLLLQLSIISAFMVYLVQYSPVLALITFSFSFLQALAVPIFAEPLHKTSEEFRHNSEDELGYISSVTANLKMISLFGRTSESIGKYRHIISDFKGISLRNLLAGASQDVVVSLLSMIGNVLIIALGAYWIMNDVLTLGAFVAFLSLNGTIKNAFAAIFSFNSSYQGFRVSAARFMSVLRAYPDTPYAGEELAAIGDIEFSGCDITVNGAVVSQNLHCLFGKGTHNLIIGANGCGKSSMFNVLCGFLPVKRGMLYVSGSDINDINTDYLRRHISCCFQDAFFLQETVLENICPAAEAERAAERLERVVQLLGIDRTRLSEKLDGCASGFSGGELQRISIARALMKDSDVYLFDEPFSNIEEKKKTELFRGICSFLADKTVIFISHDGEICDEAARIGVQSRLFDDMIHS